MYISKFFIKKYQGVLDFFKADVGSVLLIVVSWRFLIAILAIFASIKFVNPTPPWPHVGYSHWFQMWSLWDGWYYIDISMKGYLDHGQWTAFFPFYPFLINIFSYVLPIDRLAIALVISLFSLVGAGYFLVKLVQLDFNRAVAHKALILLLLYPTALFLGAVYTESLFLFLTIGCFYFSRKNNWYMVAVFGFFAALTRNLGVFLVLPLLFEYWQVNKFKIKFALLACLSPILGLLSYMFYLYLTFGDFLKFVHVQKLWGREIELNLFKAFYYQMINAFQLPIKPWAIMEFMSGALVVVIIVFAWKRLRLSYLLWMVLLALPALMQNTWGSVNRYTLVIFPSFIFLAYLCEKNKTFNNIWMMGSAMFLTLHVCSFAIGLWTG